MEDHEHYIHVVLEDSFSKPFEGLTAIHVNDSYSIWMWEDKEIVVFEGAAISGINKEFTPKEHMKKSVFKLNIKIVKIFHISGYSTVYVLDETGMIHVFEHISLNKDNSVDFMDVDDIMSSPSTDNDTKWKKDTNMIIGDSHNVIAASQFGKGIAVLTVKENQLLVTIYTLPGFCTKFILCLKTLPQDAVMSTCNIQCLTPHLKELFQSNLETFDCDIIIIGLRSGLVMWFCTNTPDKGPFILCHTHQKIQAIHWMKGSDTKYALLLIVLSSGQMIVYGNKQQETQHLPDSVKSSLCLEDYIITSNRIDSYATKLKFDKTIVLSSAALPLKGIHAVCTVPGLSYFLASTLHGSLYCMNTRIEPYGNPLEFSMPDQCLLDTLYTLTKSLDLIYFESTKEDEITKNIISAVIGRKYPDLFALSIKILSDETFSVEVKLPHNRLMFSYNLWQACAEILDSKNIRENHVMELKQDFNRANHLSLTVNYNLVIGSVVTVSLVSVFGSQHPPLEVQLGKIEIDACYLMTNHVPSQNVVRNEDPLSNILRINHPPKDDSLECNLTLKIPNGSTLDSPLATIVYDSRHNLQDDDWIKISNRKKHNIQLCIKGIPTLLNLETEIKELRITCCDAKLCHQIKEAVLKRFSSTDITNISEDICLDIQALYQSFEILKLNDEPDFIALESIKDKIREGSYIPTLLIK